MTESPATTPANRKAAEFVPAKYAADHPQEVLRRALWEARRARISGKAIVELCRRLRPDFQMTDKAIRDFVSGKSKTTSEDRREALAAFWVHSPQGRALRSFDISASPKFSEVVGLLASGRPSLNPKRTATGNYFMYHGSYLKPDHYVVRAIEVESIDGSSLVVTDSVNDTLSISGGLRVAYGAMVFVHEHPQILISADENKVGLCLFIANDSGPRTGQMTDALGVFLAMTPHHDVIYRRALLRHQPGGSAKDIIAQSGIFTLDQLRERRRKDHLAAFEQLAQHEPKTIFADPILKLGTKP